MISERLQQFIRCHEGAINKLLHAVGFALIGIGIWQKSLLFVIGGGIAQELGHFYQYSKTRNSKDSPLFCLRPQLLFAYPLFILIVVYVVAGK